MPHAYLDSDFSHIAFEYQDYKLPMPVQEYIHTSKYSRWIDALNRRETWPETVQRYMDFMYERSKKLGSAFTENEYRFLYESILFHKAMPSMRAMMSSGKAAEKDNMAIYNCAAVALNHPRVFSEILYILACGTGCGFSVERNEIVELPEVPSNLKECETVLVVRDSRIGWAQSFQALIDMLYNGQIPTWDLSKVRPAGARLKTFGGTASGPDPFNDLLHFTVKMFKGAQGRKLTSIEIHSLVCKIGDVIVSGSVRRSATISLSNLSDDRMRHAKDGEWWVNNPHFRLANNSAVYTERPEIGRFMNEWISLYESKSGERGIFNRKAARLQATRFDRRKDSSNFLTNPCQPADATLLSPSGIITMGEVKVGDSIWSETGWTTVVNKVCTGIKPVYRYQTTAGYFLGTENHKVLQNGSKIEVCQASTMDILSGEYRKITSLNPQDVMDGLMIGDGSRVPTSNGSILDRYLNVGCNDLDYVSSEISELIVKPRPTLHKKAYEVKTTITREELPLLPVRVVPERFFKGDYVTKIGFLRGLFSANGSVVGEVRITLKSTSFKMILQVQEMLSSVGINSYYTTNKPTKVVFSNGEYTCRESYDINIRKDSHKFIQNIGFLQAYKNEKYANLAGKHPTCRRSKTYFEIVSRSYIGEDEVYDITVDNEPHTYWTGGLNVSNCGEIILRGSGGLCNLSEVVARSEDTHGDLLDKIKATIYFGVLQSTFTDFRYVRNIWKKNADEERLLGVSITGIMDNLTLSGKGSAKEELSSVLQTLRDYATEFADELCDRWNLNHSAAITTVKPSGTVSQLTNSSSGIHTRYADTLIRAYRENVTSPVCKLLQDSGVPNEVDLMSNQTQVFYFPVESPKGSITRDQMTALEQLELWLVYKENWAHHSVSCTIYVKEDEWLEVGSWVYKNFDHITGLSFLPYSDHTYKQAPYTACTKEEYDKRQEKMPVIDWSKLSQYETTDMTESSQTLACVAGSCDL